MRRTAPSDLLVQWLLAGLCLSILACGFAGAGSFQEVYGSQAWESPSAGANKREVLLQAFGNSAWIGVGATALALLLGIPSGWALSRRRRSPLLLALCALPLALAPSVAVSGWLRWFAPPDVSSSFGAMAPGTLGPGALFTLPGVALVLGLGLWPIVALEAWPAFARARGEAYESALLAGSPARAFFRVVLPLARGEVAAGALLVFLLAAGDFTVSSLLLVPTLPIQVYDKLALNLSASAAWTALPLALLAALAALGLALARPGRGNGSALGWSSPEREAPPAAAALRSSRIGLLVLLLGLSAGFILPLAGCLTGACSGKKAFAEIFGAGLPALVVSLRLAGAAALAALVAGALRVACWPANSAAPLSWTGLLLLAVPGSFLAAGLLSADLQRMEVCAGLGAAGEWLNRTAPGGLLLAFGYLLRFLYLPLRLADEGLRSLDPALLDAAELAGHSRFSRGLSVGLPLVWPHLLAAAGLVFVLSMGELPVSDRLAPPGAVPVSVWLFQEQHLGYSEAVFALRPR